MSISTVTSSNPLPMLGDSQIKLMLLEFYIVSEEHSGILTAKELQEWATEYALDKNKVKHIN